ncbi:MAG: tRNA (N6-isopentenyl adenosine(37)-C2)-methylthiotransferase MiaB [Candidatus Magasanikbacteria bacterium]
MIESETKEYQYHITTLGCQMNKNDSERMETLLKSMGLVRAASEEEADVIILNSCSVRKSAEDRIFGFSRNIGKRKKDNPDLILCVTGCMPGRDKDGTFKAQLEDVDLFFPTKDMIHLPKWLCEINPHLRSSADVGADYLGLWPSHASTFQAFLTIQTGCNHFCTYCVVPFARGFEGNRSLKSILEEMSTLAEKGYKEVTLLGQIVNHYIAPDPEYFSKKNSYKKNDFAKLLWEIGQFDSIERIHWTAPHPVYMDEEVLDVLTLPKQVNFIHLPVQSGSDAMLKKMNRRHDREFYIETIRKMREKRPEISIGTDIIVGFCGETNKDVQDTIDLYKECSFDISYTAQYSERTGTVAAKAFPDDVPKEVKKERWQTLQKLMKEIVLEKNQKYVGKIVSVLVGTHHQGMCAGNSLEMKRVQFGGDESLVGRIIEVKINKAVEWILWGTKKDEV